jgi:uncharacterized protein (DUF486 family)
VILAGWGIALFGYCFQVPANRIGSYEFNAAQLKTIQEVNHTRCLRCFLPDLPGRKAEMDYGVAAAFLALAVFFVFHKW